MLNKDEKFRVTGFSTSVSDNGQNFVDQLFL